MYFKNAAQNKASRMQCVWDYNGKYSVKNSEIRIQIRVISKVYW